MNTLYVDATVRTESRTAVLAEYLLQRLGGATETVKLSTLRMPTTDAAFLAKRDRACAIGDFSDEMFALARQFAAAECIVIAAPFWDLSFPASLKQYLEQISVNGLTFAYSPKGIPYGLCKVKKVYYVTTSGGQILCDAYGFGYVKALAEGFWGAEECILVKAEGLDVYGADVEGILAEAKQHINRISACGEL